MAYKPEGKAVRLSSRAYRKAKQIAAQRKWSLTTTIHEALEAYAPQPSTQPQSSAT